MTTIFAPPSNASKWQMEFNSAFKGCMKNQQIHQLFIQFINYVWQLLHVSALHCLLQGAFLVPAERCSIEEQPIEYFRLVCDVVRRAHHVTRHNTPQHPQYSIDCSSIEHLSEGTRNAP